MKIAVINEFSSKERNSDILSALKNVNATIFNVGMKNGANDVELTYIHTGIMAGILLAGGAVDFVVGGCGTGQGFAISAMQFPSVFCGIILEPVDAWLFSQINAGNCISLALSKGYGWAANFNLNYIFEKLFQDEAGGGYPVERKISQAERRDKLKALSAAAHRSLVDILSGIHKDILEPILAHKPFCDLVANAQDKAVADWFDQKLKEKNKNN